MSKLNLNFPAIQPLQHSRAQFRSVIPSTLLARFQFGAFGATDAESILLSARNRAPGADQSGITPFGGIEVFANFFRFDGGVDAIRTAITEPLEWTMYIVARSSDTGLGADATARARVAGWRAAGGADSVIYANNNTAWRTLAYENPTTPAFKTSDLSIPSVANFTRFAVRVTTTQVQSFNLSGTGSDSAAVSFAAARHRGGAPFSIGDGFVDTYLKSVDVHSIELHAAAYDSTQRAAVNAQMVEGLKLAALVA